MFGVDLAQELYGKLKEAGYLDAARWWGDGSAQVTTHAEALALYKVYKELGTLPESLVMNVDRYACPTCQTYLPDVFKFLGGKNLTILSADGRIIPITIVK